MRPYLNKLKTLADMALLLAFFGLFPLFIAVSPAEELKLHAQVWVFAAYSGIALYFAFRLLYGDVNREARGIETGWRSLLSAIVAFGLFVLNLSAITLDGWPGSNQTAVLLIDLSALTLLLIIFPHLYRYKVPGGMLVVMDQRIYYPGEVFNLNPLHVFARPKVEVVPAKIVFDPGEIEPILMQTTTATRDRYVQIHILSTVVELNLAKAQANEVRQLDYEWFRQEVAAWVRNLLQNSVGTELPLHRLLCPTGGAQYTDLGIPVAWRGEYEASYTTAVPLPPLDG